MNKIKTAVVSLVVVALFAGWGFSSEPAPKGPSPATALKWLQDGNQRFVCGKAFHPHTTAERRKETAKDGQHPYATILTCSDSRVPAELIFDEGIGDLFVVRVAGNVCNVDETATIEYGTDHLGTPVLVVLGHTMCGAVTAVVTGAELHGSIPQLVESVKLAAEKAHIDFPDLKGKDLVPAAIEANAWQAIEDLLIRSDMTRTLVKEGKLQIVGALYDIDTGKVKWLGTHPNQEKLLKLPSEKPAAPAAAETAHQPAAPQHPAEKAPVPEKHENKHH